MKVRDFVVGPFGRSGRPTRSSARPVWALAAALALTALLALGATAATAAPPSATINPVAPADVSFTAAKASGEVNPDGSETYVYFQWATQTQFDAAEWEGFAGFTVLPEGTEAPLPVEGELGPLAPSTVYHVRLVAENVSSEREEAIAAETFKTKAASPPLLSLQAPSAITASSAHLEGTVNSNGTGEGQVTHWSLGCESECPSFSGSAEGDTESGADVDVSADLTGLEPHREYTVRLSATNFAGLTAEASESFTTDPIAPELSAGKAAAEVSDTSARVFALLNPHNSPATYRFQYGTTTAYGSSTEAGGPLNGNSPQTASRLLSSLQPSTTYHYRAVADNGTGGEIAGPDGTFTTEAARAACPNEAIRQEQASTYLPECMAYELISPVDTLGFDVTEGFADSDPDHAWVAFLTPAAAEAATANVSVYRAARGEDGWRLHDLASGTPPGNENIDLRWISADRTRVLATSCNTTLTSCPYDRKLDLIGPGDVHKTLISFPAGSPFALRPEITGAATDLSRVFLATYSDDAPLLSLDTHAAGRGLYGLDEDGGLEYVALDESGHALPCGAVLGNDVIGTNPGSGFEQNGLSGDGRTVVFESPDPDSGCPEPTDVYVRQDGHSRNVSAPSGLDPDLGARYVGNSIDGRLVYFISASALSDQDLGEAADLYRYDTSTETLTPITTEAGVIRGGVSRDGDYVYFTAEAQIAGQGEAGADNLYVFHDGEIRFIAPLHGSYGIGAPLSGFASKTGAIAPDGQTIVFSSNDPELTRQTAETPTFQVLRFSLRGGPISCVSCPPDGSAPAADVFFPDGPPRTTKRLLSDDGETVAFGTSEALLPIDTNGLEDVYIWHHGMLSLLSSGRADSTATPHGMSADGTTIIFATSASLLPGLEQENLKLYGARIDGGFPAPRPAPICEGESCHGLPSAPPPFSPPPTSSTGAKPPQPQRGRRLAHALRRCKARKGKARKKCESQAKRHFGAKLARNGSHS